MLMLQNDKKMDAAPAPKPTTPVAEERNDAQPDAHPLAPELPETDAPMLATPTDFELEAHDTIAVENLGAELDRLDAEIRSVDQ